MSVSDELYPFQRAAVEFALARDGAALFMEQGVGKTHVTAGVIEALMARGGTRFLCVVPLANVETTWARLTARIDGLTVCRSWRDFRARAGPRLLLLHYEALRGRVVRSIVKAGWDLVAYDESQRLKARGSKASRAAARFRDVTHRLILSGTPIEQCPQDLWAQLRFACPSVLGTRWADFDSAWLRPCGFMGYEREFVPGRLPAFLDTIAPHVLRVTKSDALDLPPLTYEREIVPLLGDQRRVYDELESDSACSLDDGTEIVCDMAITRLVRLQQVVGGFVRTADGEDVSVGRAKERRLGIVMRRELALGPVVVFCKYDYEIETVTRAARPLTDHLRWITGKISKRDRVRTIEEFQAGRVDALVCQVRTGGVGLDLQVANTAIFYSAPFSYIDFEQAVSRLHRNGQRRPVRVILIQAQNTVDKTIYGALLNKRNVVERVLDHTRRSKMAKKESAPAAKNEGKAKPTPPPQPPKPKYGVPELAEAMGIKTSSVRVRLRNAAVPKNGKLYGWDSKAEMQEVIAKLNASAGRKKKSDEN